MWTLLLLLILCVIRETNSGGSVSNFECYPNQTIRFTNPNPGLYTHFKAVYGIAPFVADCNVTTDDGNNYAYMDCPSTSTTVTLYISSRNLSSGDSILDKDSAAYSFKCSPISTYEETLTNSLKVNITETAESDAPVFNITSAFYSPAGEIVTVATVGQTVYYVIGGPTQYDLKPLQCNATGSEDNEHTTLIVNGCSEDMDLIQNFIKVTEGQETFYNSSVHVFKFYKSDTLTITCNVMVCSDSDDCSFSCVTDRRKRFVTITSEFKREVRDDLKMSTVGNSLRILDAQLGGSANVPGSVHYLSITVILLSLVVL